MPLGNAIELAREVAAAALGPGLGDVQEIVGGQNAVFKVLGPGAATHIVKLHTGNNTLVGDVETAAYRRLAGAAEVRKVAASGVMRETSYIIVEYVEGKTLLDAYEAAALDDSQLGRVAGHIVALLRQCFAFQTSGAGKLDSDLRGSAASWSEHLISFVNGVSSRVQQLPNGSIRRWLQDTCVLVETSIVKENASLVAVKPVFVPVDLNLRNWLLTDAGRVLLLDLGAFWGADPLFAFGEWAGHTWGTKLYSSVISAWGGLSEHEERKVRFYALLSNLSVSLYVALRDPGAVAQQGPWGNPSSFAQLIDGHRAALARSGA